MRPAATAVAAMPVAVAVAVRTTACSEPALLVVPALDPPTLPA
jgi:hypothetical protein